MNHLPALLWICVSAACLAVGVGKWPVTPLPSRMYVVSYNVKFIDGGMGWGRNWVWLKEPKGGFADIQQVEKTLSETWSDGKPPISNLLIISVIATYEQPEAPNP